MVAQELGLPYRHVHEFPTTDLKGQSEDIEEHHPNDIFHLYTPKTNSIYIFHLHLDGYVTVM
jgi:hypothetical protein